MTFYSVSDQIADARMHRPYGTAYPKGYEYDEADFMIAFAKSSAVCSASPHPLAGAFAAAGSLLADTGRAVRAIAVRKIFDHKPTR